jgi:hypothetical protein
MYGEAQSSAAIYLEWVRALYRSIRSWVDGTPFRIEEHEIEIQDGDDTYAAPALIVRSPGEGDIADIRPVGSSIIGAEGRIDIVGRASTENLVYLLEGGSQVHYKVSEPAALHEHRRPLFAGISHPGWYWIEEKRLGRARPVDRQLFLELLSEAADYEPS